VADDDFAERTWRVIVDIAGMRHLASTIELGQSIFDLGIDSLRLVDLTLALEDEFALSKLDMLGWVEREKVANGAKFTVGSMAEACRLAKRHRTSGESSR
jgi:acyl carrier protein